MANFLSKKIKQNILNFGPISVAEFMQQSLFDPEHGYYATKDPFGAEGDFITAPEISQIFGEVIAAYIIYYWQKIGKPKKFQIVELGPGRGSLMTDILRVSKTNSEFYAALSVTLIELSPKLRAVQRANLANFAVELTHYDNFTEVKEMPSFIVANEFFDALPIRQYQYNQGNWHERKIALDQHNKFMFKLEKNEDLIKFKTHNLPIKNGDIYEISYSALTLMQEIADFLVANNSASLIIDYGYMQPNFGDSLQAIKKHKFCDIFTDLGAADLTAHVDFAALAEIATAKVKLKVTLTTQREFFLNLGFKERSKFLQDKFTNKAAQLKQAEVRILAKEQMGELFKVLLVEAP